MRRRIDARLKLASIALEPPIDASAMIPDPALATRLGAALAAPLAEWSPFPLNEGYRTVDSRRRLSGQPSSKPYGHSGAILTNADGVKSASVHQGQGMGVPGTGRAADCCTVKDGSAFISPANDPVCARHVDAVEKAGLRAGLPSLSSSIAPQCGLP